MLQKIHKCSVFPYFLHFHSYFIITCWSIINEENRNTFLQSRRESDPVSWKNHRSWNFPKKSRNSVFQHWRPSCWYFHQNPCVLIFEMLKERLGLISSKETCLSFLFLFDSHSSLCPVLPIRGSSDKPYFTDFVSRCVSTSYFTILYLRIPNTADRIRIDWTY